MIVVLSHYSNESGIWGGYLGQGAGQLGVMLFFLLSYFLMAHLYFDSPPTIENIKKLNELKSEYHTMDIEQKLGKIFNG